LSCLHGQGNQPLFSRQRGIVLTHQKGARDEDEEVVRAADGADDVPLFVPLFAQINPDLRHRACLRARVELREEETNFLVLLFMPPPQKVLRPSPSVCVCELASLADSASLVLSLSRYGAVGAVGEVGFALASGGRVPNSSGRRQSDTSASELRERRAAFFSLSSHG